MDALNRSSSSNHIDAYPRGEFARDSPAYTRGHLLSSAKAGLALARMVLSLLEKDRTVSEEYRPAVPAFENEKESTTEHHPS